MRFVATLLVLAGLTLCARADDFTSSSCPNGRCPVQVSAPSHAPAGYAPMPAGNGPTVLRVGCGLGARLGHFVRCHRVAYSVSHPVVTVRHLVEFHPVRRLLSHRPHRLFR